MLHAELDLGKVDLVLKNHGLEDGGPIQLFFTNEVIRMSDPYVPMDIAGGGGILKDNITIFPDGDGYSHNSIYAQVHWHGKVMRDENGRAFYGKAPKFVTDEDMNYQGAPIRGPKWVLRMWANDGNDIIKSVQKKVDDGKNER